MVIVRLVYIHHSAAPTGMPLAEAARACVRCCATLEAGRAPATAAGCGARQPSARSLVPQHAG